MVAQFESWLEALVPWENIEDSDDKESGTHQEDCDKASDSDEQEPMNSGDISDMEQCAPSNFLCLNIDAECVHSTITHLFELPVTCWHSNV